MLKKSGQAMSEFLITYGWAVIVILVLIGGLSGLAQVGLIRSDHIVPERCILDVGVSCNDFNVNEDRAAISLINGLGKNIKVENISIGGNCSETFKKNFDSGEIIIFELFNCSNGERKKRFDGEIVIYYQEERRKSFRTIKGDITARII